MVLAPLSACQVTRAPPLEAAGGEPIAAPQARMEKTAAALPQDAAAGR